jgi:hypothetical protein
MTRFNEEGDEFQVGNRVGGRSNERNEVLCERVVVDFVPPGEGVEGVGEGAVDGRGGGGIGAAR